MTHSELCAMLAELQWSQVELSRRTGMTTQSVNAWCQGNTPVPKWLTAYMELLINIRGTALLSGACKK